LLLAILGLALERVQGLRPAIGLVTRGHEGRLGKVRLEAKLYRDAEQVLDEARGLQQSGEAPPLTLNRHCHFCEFRQRCRTAAIEKDSISLLETVSEKELRKLSCTARVSLIARSRIGSIDFGVLGPTRARPPPRLRGPSLSFAPLVSLSSWPASTKPGSATHCRRSS
jgi:hypothetical protein